MFVAQKKSLDEVVRFMQTKTDAVIVVTLGSKGSAVFAGREKHQIPAFPPANVGDPTGAGDTYAAAFIRATHLYLYSSLVSQGTFAAMAATMKIERSGAFAGNLKDVLSRLAASGVMLS